MRVRVQPQLTLWEGKDPFLEFCEEGGADCRFDCVRQDLGPEARCFRDETETKIEAPPR